MWEAPWHWVVVALVVIALFGYKKLPDAARSLGHSLRIFKTEIKGMADDDSARAKQDQVQAGAAGTAGANGSAAVGADPAAPVPGQAAQLAQGQSGQPSGSAAPVRTDKPATGE